MQPPDRSDLPAWCDVVVIGAGVSAIGVACHLRDALPDMAFTVLEARDDLGGTWDLFRYPGRPVPSDARAVAWPPSPGVGANVPRAVPPPFPSALPERRATASS